MSNASRLSASRYRAVLGLLAVLTVVAVDTANVPGYWVDERITIMLIERWTVWELFTVLPIYQPHFPTYYVLLEVFGVGVMRVVSWLSLALLVWGTVELAREYVTDRDALLAGLLVSVSPFLATQASWVRMYGVFSLLGVWLVVWTVRGQWRRAWLAAAACAVLHVWGVFPVLWLTWQHYQRERRQTAVVLGGVLLLPAVALFAVGVGTSVSTASTGVGHGTIPSLLMIMLVPVSSVAGSPHTVLQIGLGLVASVVLIWDWREWPLVSWVVLPVVVISLASLVHPVFRLKYFGFVGPVVAVGLVCERPAWRDRLLWLSVGGMIVVSWILRQGDVLMARRFVFWL